MKYLKPGVQIACMEPALLEAILSAHALYIEAEQNFTITSLTDGKHRKDSLHYKGRAFDLRTKDLRDITAEGIAKRLRAFLGNDYDVVVEKDHIHVEHDPD